MAPRANHWTDDEHDGTLFHEIITLPMLAPHLACPEHLVPYLPQSTTQAANVSGQVPPGDTQITTQVASLPPTGSEVSNETDQAAARESLSFIFLPTAILHTYHIVKVLEWTFFITVVMSFYKPAPGPHTKPKKASETKSGPAVPLLTMSRCEVLKEVLKLHDLHSHYQPSEISGYPVKISWSGSL
jgi:hypothetical protein